MTGIPPRAGFSAGERQRLGRLVPVPPSHCRTLRAGANGERVPTGARSPRSRYRERMTPYEAAEVFALFAEAEDFENGVFWRVDMTPGRNREMRLFAECSDLFFWGTADCEEITPADVPLLRHALDDLKPLGAEYELGHLFAARKRKLRPQKPCYKDMAPAVAALYDACCAEEEREAASKKDAAQWIALAHQVRGQ